jgi:hypothetical protein
MNESVGCTVSENSGTAVCGGIMNEGSVRTASNTSSASRTWGLTRFTNVTIPKGSTINTAVWQPNFTTTKSDDPNDFLHAHAVDNSGVLVQGDTSFDIFNRARTTASVLWVATALGTGYHAAPDISTVIQEIVNRSGWVSGNALSIIIKPNTDAAFSFNF